MREYKIDIIEFLVLFMPLICEGRPSVAVVAEAVEKDDGRGVFARRGVSQFGTDFRSGHGGVGTPGEDVLWRLGLLFWRLQCRYLEERSQVTFGEPED
jgi:hypothetical protein